MLKLFRLVFSRLDFIHILIYMSINVLAYIMFLLVRLTFMDAVGESSLDSLSK